MGRIKFGCICGLLFFKLERNNCWLNYKIKEYKWWVRFKDIVVLEFLSCVYVEFVFVVSKLLDGS